MRRARRLRKAPCLLSLLLAAAGCGEADFHTPSAGTRSEMPLVLIDEGGTRWERIGKATFLETGEVERPEQPPADGFDPRSVPLDRLAEYLTPVMLLGGTEYRASRQDAMKIALSVRQAPSNPLIGNRDIEMAQQNEILESVDPRRNFNSRAGEFPFNQIATLRRPDNGIPGRYSCTCFKMLNTHTCITAAHCVANDNFVKNNKQSFKWPAMIKFKAGATGWGFNATGIVDPDEHSYSIMFPLGYWTSPRPALFDYAVIRFRGKYLGSPDPMATAGNLTPIVCATGGAEKCSHPDSPDVPAELYDTGGANGFLSWTTVPERAGQNVAVVGYPARPDPAALGQCADAHAAFPWPSLAYGEGLLAPPKPELPHLYYGASTCSGQSGSPVFLLDTPWCIGNLACSNPPPRTVAGVHIEAANGVNKGIKFTAEIVHWMNIVGGH